MGITETTTASSSNGTILSLKMFQDIFKHIEPEVQIDSFELEPGSGRGDNYTATLYRIVLTGQKHTPTDGKKLKWEKNIICKRLPENLERREAYKSDKLFSNEVEFYTTIMPELLKFQSTKTDVVFNAIPKCYFARPDLLIMEDLRVRGFQMPDRKKGLTYDETRTVLKEVAQFHALSLAYKFEKPKQFDTLRNLTSEGLFCITNESWYKRYYENLTKNAIKMVSDVLPADSKYLAAMKDFITVDKTHPAATTENHGDNVESTTPTETAAPTSFFQRMVQLVSTESPLSAICHGDCWANNFLYRYELTEDEVKVLEVCLVDFQLIRYSSIALDIANLLFCCTSKSMRDEHLNSFLKHYTSELFGWLERLCTKIPEFCDTAEKFDKLFRGELKIYGRFALGLALDIIPISTCSPEDAPDLYLNNHRNSSGNDEIEIGAPELNFPPNDLCRQKMSEIVIDLVEQGML